MSGSVLQLNPPATYDPYAWQKKQAEAQGAEADTVQKQIANELANLNLQYKAAYQSEIIPGWGGQAPKVGNPLANANSGGFIGALGGAVKAGINALAPEAAPSGGNALALASPRRADPTLSTGPEGIVFPGSGIAMPKAWAMAAGADPEKAAGVLKEYQSWQRTTVSQAISSATDPQSWDTQVALLWKNGIITTQTAQQMSGKFAQREYLRDALAAPEAQMGNTLSGTQGGFARTPGGYVAGGPGPAAAGNVARERTAGAGDVTPFTTGPVPTGRLNPDGTPEYAPINTTQSGAARSFSAPPGGGALPPGVTRDPRRGNQIAPNFDPVTGQPLTYSTTPPPMPPGARPGGGSAAPPLPPWGAGPGPAVPPGGAPTVTIPPVPGIPGPPLGAVAGIEQNQNAYRTEQAAVSKLPLQNTQLVEAADAIRRLAASNLTTGPGQAALLQVRKFISGFGGTPEMQQNAIDAVTAEKYLAQAIASQLPASDARQALLEKATPGLGMPPGASIPIIARIVASNRAREAIVKTAPRDGNGFLSHQAEQSALLNSREGLAALSYDLMDAKARDALKEDLKAGRLDMDRFNKAFRIAHSDGVK